MFLNELLCGRVAHHFGLLGFPGHFQSGSPPKTSKSMEPKRRDLGALLDVLDSGLSSEKPSDTEGFGFILCGTVRSLSSSHSTALFSCGLHEGLGTFSLVLRLVRPTLFTPGWPGQSGLHPRRQDGRGLSTTLTPAGYIDPRSCFLLSQQLSA